MASQSTSQAADGEGLTEGSALGCNLVTSKNCGNWEICHPTLLAHPLTVSRVVSRIRQSVDAPVPDNMGYFLHKRSYEKFLEILSTLRPI